ncbi:unnamed protein product [Urochloa humidicola]
MLSWGFLRSSLVQDAEGSGRIDMLSLGSFEPKAILLLSTSGVLSSNLTFMCQRQSHMQRLTSQTQLPVKAKV